MLFEALALSLGKELPVAQAVRHIGIDETSLRKGHEYVTAVHDLGNRPPNLTYRQALHSAKLAGLFNQPIKSHAATDRTSRRPSTHRSNGVQHSPCRRHFRTRAAQPLPVSQPYRQ
jgi:hypothetical protein